jgi:2-iminobutanoate/2-iminopropanoate deaminase
VTSDIKHLPNTLDMPLKPITSDRVAKPVGPFSPAVRDGDRVYTSGQIAQDPATGKLIEGGVVAQTEQILQNLEAIMSAANKSLADVVKVNVYLTDMRNFAEMNEVYARHFVAPYPARTTVAVAALPLGAAVEIELIASE